MKQIVPVQVWFQGNEVLANQLDIVISFDNLSTYAIFAYTLLETVQTESVDIEGNPITTYTYIPVANGTVNMGGDDYTNWDDSNQAAYAYVASKINVTLV